MKDVSQPNDTGKRPTKKSGVVVPHSPSWKQRIAAFLVWAFIRLVASTVRFRIHDTGLFQGKRPGTLIYCIWHNRLAMSLTCYQTYAHPRNPTSGIAALVSASRDGAFLAAVLEAFRVQPVRGSSSRRGAQALLELTSWAEKGYDLAITPDGPRGPRYVVQPGVMWLAQLTGRPILPVSYNLRWKIQLKSWDRFQIPLPFTRCDVRAGDLMTVPSDASEEERNRLREELQSALMRITED
jgi:lysophospholipid acyltransferase (LPLAT)-like uncharacterized protein